ncbi:MAG: hypothetical protein BGO89_06725 [Candidatus Kapaibacterium thiocyanatum]|uniref:Uncharacterized protein n=1 Tax=Candidatus Kapaibacterium thiocyanatum TaxID=1895771 RepID=A0A1M3KYU6_9BACT|nr:MAG: hypothetical protein BGO89_06725 ['Candidatus Kapabacteria' thiocyanatum]
MVRIYFLIARIADASCNGMLRSILQQHIIPDWATLQIELLGRKNIDKVMPSAVIARANNVYLNSIIIGWIIGWKQTLRPSSDDPLNHIRLCLVARSKRDLICRCRSFFEPGFYHIVSRHFRWKAQGDVARCATNEQNFFSTNNAIITVDMVHIL